MKQHKSKRYDTYYFNLKDWVIFIAGLAIKVLIICYLFYDSYKAILLLIPFSILDYKRVRFKKLEEQKRELTLEFKELIEALVTSLNAGYSMEHSFIEARRDLSLMYKEEALIFEEIDSILAGLKVNIPLEKLLVDFGERSGNDDIKNFSNVVTIAKKSGGNLIRIIQKTVNSISDKIAVEEEIETMITAKKFEQRIMMLMPYGIIFYLRVTNGDFLSVLYHNLLGIVLMTVFLILIYIADLWAVKIMDIKV